MIIVNGKENLSLAVQHSSIIIGNVSEVVS